MNARKSAAVHLLSGKQVKTNRLNLSLPTPEAGIPTPPKHLSNAARVYWKKIVPQLDAMGILTKVDATAIEMLCETYADIQGLRELQPLTPAIARQISDTDRRLKNWLNEFGLTPASRSRVTAAEKSEDRDEFDF